MIGKDHRDLIQAMAPPDRVFRASPQMPYSQPTPSPEPFGILTTLGHLGASARPSQPRRGILGFMLPPDVEDEGNPRGLTRLDSRTAGSARGPSSMSEVSPAEIMNLPPYERWLVTLPDDSPALSGLDDLAAGTEPPETRPTAADDRSRVDEMLEELAQTMPVLSSPQGSIRQREADFWLQFDPKGLGFDDTVEKMAASYSEIGGDPAAFLTALGLIYRTARSETLRRFPDDPQHNTRADAFRHAYASGRLAHAFGSADAKRLMDAYERSHPNPNDERYADLLANWFARAVEGHPGLEGIDRVSLLRRAIDLGLIPSGLVPIR